MKPVASSSTESKINPDKFDVSPGSVVDCKIVAKNKNEIIVKFGKSFGKIPLIHLHDDICVGNLILRNLQEGANIRAMIIDLSRGYTILTIKNLLMINRERIPKSIASIKMSELYYGYVSKHAPGGAIV